MDLSHLRDVAVVSNHLLWVEWGSLAFSVAGRQLERQQLVVRSQFTFARSFSPNSAFEFHRQNAVRKSPVARRRNQAATNATSSPRRRSYPGPEEIHVRFTMSSTKLWSSWQASKLGTGTWSCAWSSIFETLLEQANDFIAIDLNWKTLWHAAQSFLWIYTPSTCANYKSSIMPMMKSSDRYIFTVSRL